MENKIKHTGYKVPKDYFKTFEDRLFSKIETTETAQTGFKVPEGYFNSLEDQLLNKINAQKNPSNRTGKVISLFKSKKILWAVSVAASLVLVFSLINTNKTTINEISTTEIADYITNNESDFTESIILTYINEDEITQLTEKTTLINDQTLEDYLLENIDETSLLTQ
jgi:hypothetical protein